MKTLKLLRYALLLVAAVAYMNGPAPLLAASPAVMSCDECTSETPCDTECNGTYAEEPTYTDCGTHRNFGGQCAGECGDNFCDPYENPSNCCTDCNPWGCSGVCVPDWHQYRVAGPFASEAFIWFWGYNWDEECWQYSCDYREYGIYQAFNFDEDCEDQETDPECLYDIVDWWGPFCANSQWDAEWQCYDHFWWRGGQYGTPGVCE